MKLFHSASDEAKQRLAKRRRKKRPLLKCYMTKPLGVLNMKQVYTKLLKRKERNKNMRTENDRKYKFLRN